MNELNELKDDLLESQQRTQELLEKFESCSDTLDIFSQTAKSIQNAANIALECFQKLDEKLDQLDAATRKLDQFDINQMTDILDQIREKDLHELKKDTSALANRKCLFSRRVA